MDSNYIMYIILGVLGAVLGSFAGAQVWRLRARQLVEDKQAGEPYDKDEYKQLITLTKHRGTADRSRCLHCKRNLKWYDLLPLVSWSSTGGRCRYCHHSIGLFEPLMELGLAAFFVISFIFWPTTLVSPLAIVQFGLWLIAGVMLAILFAYDIKWFLLPDRIIFPLIGLAAGYSVLAIVSHPQPLEAVISTGWAVLILSGLYLGLWLISKGQWIGFGDVKLGLALGLLGGSWQLAFLTLFLANLIGCLIVLPGLVTKKLSRSTQVPFGPMLIAGCVIAVLFGNSIINWYFTILL